MANVPVCVTKPVEKRIANTPWAAAGQEMLPHAESQLVEL